MVSCTTFGGVWLVLISLTPEGLVVLGNAGFPQKEFKKIIPSESAALSLDICEIYEAESVADSSSDRSYQTAWEWNNSLHMVNQNPLIAIASTMFICTSI
jgi:hypothetical protein